jgi:pimeloyl-ACP methyl ester carboxylesterase
MDETTEIRPPSGFGSEDGEKRYFEAYDATLELWPVPHDSIRVATGFGSTHLIASGPEDAPVLFLLHASSWSATQWLANVAVLSQQFRVYALDILGEPGKSVQTRSLRTGVDTAEWLVDVFNELEIQQACVCGHSFGGWITVNLALHAPERLKKIVLMAPAASIYPFKTPVKFSIRCGRFMWMLPTRMVVNATLKTMFAHPERVNPAFMRQFGIGVKEFRFPKGGVFPAEFAEQELRRLEVSTLLLIGEKEEIYPPHKAMNRAKRLIPDLRAELVPDAGHGLPIDRPELVNAKILEFLAD